MSHINVVCEKCGLTGHSKNPATRSVFANEWPQHPQIKGAEAVAPAFVDDKGYLRIRMYVGDKPVQPESLKYLADILSGVAEAGPETVRVYVCEHEFVPASKEDADNIVVW